MKKKSSAAYQNNKWFYLFFKTHKLSLKLIHFDGALKPFRETINHFHKERIGREKMKLLSSHKWLLTHTHSYTRTKEILFLVRFRRGYRSAKFCYFSFCAKCIFMFFFLPHLDFVVCTQSDAIKNRFSFSHCI
jgi:hypothetical protein